MMDYVYVGERLTPAEAAPVMGVLRVRRLQHGAERLLEKVSRHRIPATDEGLGFAA
jgi:hypothetical protein